MTRQTLDNAAALNLCTYKDRATGIWVIRDKNTGAELAHETNRRDALKALKMHTEKKAAA